eukprot:11198753-Alexandrium_andersonii.AAC.1
MWRSPVIASRSCGRLREVRVSTCAGYDVVPLRSSARARTGGTELPRPRGGSKDLSRPRSAPEFEDRTS